MKMINRIKLYIKEEKNVFELKNIVASKLQSNGFEIVDYDYELAISIGGDGTFLKMIHDNNFNENIYYVGINAGSLGFLSSYSINEIDKLIQCISNDFKLKELSILKTIVTTDNNDKEYLSINELTVRTSDFSSMKSSIYINNQLLNNFNGDGLVIGTMIGSTAYNAALNGPLIDNDIDSFVITPIAPINNRIFHTFTNSIVLSANKEIKIIPYSDNICIVSDGKIDNIQNIKEINCVFLPNKIKCIIPSNYEYITVIKTKIIDTK